MWPGVILASRQIAEYEIHRLPSVWKGLTPKAENVDPVGNQFRQEQQESLTLADLRGLTGSIANGFRVGVCDIPGPRMRGTGGTLICGLEISRDRGHAPKPLLFLIRALCGTRHGRRQTDYDRRLFFRKAPAFSANIPSASQSISGEVHLL
jgi:hypothetical protein